MKRVICILLCLLLLFTGSGAWAFWGDPHPLTQEPLYDPSAGILFGTIVWSDIGGDNKLHYMNLETGETNRFDLDGYHYPVYSDLPSAVVAREYGGNFFLYQMDLEGNLTPILEMQLPSTAYLHRGSYLPATVWAYYDGWLYYNQSENYSEAIALARVNLDENKLYAYRTMPYNTPFALSPKGKLAWFENSLDGREEITLLIQNPEDDSLVEIPFTGEYAEINPVAGQPAWADEDTLIFCGCNAEDVLYPLYAYHLSSGIIRRAKHENGRDIILPYEFWDNVLFNQDNSQLFVGSVSWADVSCIVDMHSGQFFRVIDPPFSDVNRLIWYNE